jgi:hypothetical protein
MQCMCCAYTKVGLASPSMCMASEHEIEDRAWVTWMMLVTLVLSTFEIISPAVTIGGGILDEDHVITRKF